jgi:hypothetical protein
VQLRCHPFIPKSLNPKELALALMQLLGGSGIHCSGMELEAIFQNAAILRSSMKVLEADSLTQAPLEPMDYQFPDPQKK